MCELVGVRCTAEGHRPGLSGLAVMSINFSGGYLKVRLLNHNGSDARGNSSKAKLSGTSRKALKRPELRLTESQLIVRY